MFYATKIKEVSGDKAIDERGSLLSFVGYLPVTAGDTVFTDGNVIFGNAKVKGYSVVDEENIAIPVLAAEASRTKEEMRGYFTNDGRYKKFAINKDDWIINDKNNFKHGKSEMNGQKIIEVEFSEDGNLWTVTDGEYRECQTTTFENHLYVIRRTIDDDENATDAEEGSGENEEGSEDDEEIIKDDYIHPYATFLKVNSYMGSDITLGTNDETVDNSITIYKGEEEVTKFNLIFYANTVKAKSLAVKDKIMAKSANPYTSGAVNFIKQTNPPEPFVASAWARALSFKINKKGDWDAIISAGAYGYCFPYLVLNGSVIHPTFNPSLGGSREFSEGLIECKNNIERSLFRESTFTFLEVEKYPTFQGTVKDSETEEYTEEYKRYIENAIEYYIPLVRFNHYEWYIVAFGASMLFHVHNGELVTVMQTRNHVGNNVYPWRQWDESQFYGITEVNGESYRAPNSAFVDISAPGELSEWQFPIDDNYYLLGKGIFFKGILNSKTGEIINPPHIGYWHVTDQAPSIWDDGITVASISDTEENQSPYGVEFIYDEKTENVAKAENVYYSYVFNHEYALPRSYYYYATTNHVNGATNLITYDQFPDERLDAPNLKPYRFTDGFFDSKVRSGLDSESRDGLYRYNPSIVKLSGRKYLFGNYNHVLQLKTSDKWNDIADYLKNFRLRELKNIRKAKT